mgnify:FL=1
MARSLRSPSPTTETGLLWQKLKRPQFALPAAIVVVMLGVAFGVQPGSTVTGAREQLPATTIEDPEPTLTATPSPSTPTPRPSPTASTTAPAGASSATPGSEVAGARSTPAASPTPDPALQQPTQCGSLQEASVPLSVEQAISGVSIKATRAAIYPIDYFRCILVATGGNEALTLASSVARAEQQDMTTIVLIDLWIANSSRHFGQVNLRSATLAAAGQVFSPLATLGGRSEVVVSSGQGRTVSIAVAIKNNVGETTGPVTLVVEGPLSAGTPVAGKYQLFLPTP